MSEQKNRDDINPLTEFRLGKLEAGMSELSISVNSIKEAVLRIEEKFKNGFPSCSLHQQKLTDAEIRIDTLELAMDKMKEFQWKFLGGVAVVMVIIQLFGPMLLDSLKSHSAGSPPFSQTVHQ